MRYAIISLLLSLSAFGAWILYAKWHGWMMALGPGREPSGWLSWDVVGIAGFASTIGSVLALACALAAVRRGPLVWGLLALAASAAVCVPVWSVVF